MLAETLLYAGPFAQPPEYKGTQDAIFAFKELHAWIQLFVFCLPLRISLLITLESCNILALWVQEVVFAADPWQWAATGSLSDLI